MGSKNYAELNGAKILIVDDQPANRDLLIKALEPEGCRMISAPSGEVAIKIVPRVKPDLILLDIVMPGLNGFEVCQQLKANTATQTIPIIFVTAKGETEDIVQGFRLGGVDYITKPFEKEEVLARVHTHLKINSLTRELLRKNQKLQHEIDQREKAETARALAEEALKDADEELTLISEAEVARWGIKGFIGQSQTLKRILKEIRQLQEVGTTSVLIAGESGTGKELIARAIHFGGVRKNGRFVPLNCSAIPSELIESALFGHVRGAFTGAIQTRKGFFERASGGTLFLDEIGDMPYELQAKLLRVLEDGGFTPVGDTDEKQVDTRIIAATNADLPARIAAGAFREDLYYRLARFTVEVPPLRQRREDIPLLAQHFLNQFSAEMGHQSAALSQEAQEMLVGYDFPGNVRELKNIIEHALILSSGWMIQPEHLHFIPAAPETITVPVSTDSTKSSNSRQRLEELVIKRSSTASPHLESDEEKILAYLREHSSINNSECRQLLGVSRNRAKYLLRKLHRYSLLAQEGERRWQRYSLA